MRSFNSNLDQSRVVISRALSQFTRLPKQHKHSPTPSCSVFVCCCRREDDSATGELFLPQRCRQLSIRRYSAFLIVSVTDSSCRKRTASHETSPHAHGPRPHCQLRHPQKTRHVCTSPDT